jgi:hypothetical protein
MGVVGHDAPKEQFRAQARRFLEKGDEYRTGEAAIVKDRVALVCRDGHEPGGAWFVIRIVGKSDRLALRVNSHADIVMARSSERARKGLPYRYEYGQRVMTA